MDIKVHKIEHKELKVSGISFDSRKIKKVKLYGKSKKIFKKLLKEL